MLSLTKIEMHSGVEPVALALSQLGEPFLQTDLTNHNNLQFFGKVFIGTPPQEFTAIFDTGSDAIWVPGQACTSAACKDHHLFDHNASSTASLSPEGDGMSYGTGTVKLQPALETVRICGKAGCAENELVSHGRPIGLATHKSDRPFAKLPFDGIAGFPPSSSKGGILDDFFKSQPSSHPRVMSVYLSNDTSIPGSVALGGVEPHHIAGSDVHWHTLTSPGHQWALKMEDIAIDGQRMHVCPQGGCDALVDTGSSLITGPTRLMSKVLTQLGTQCEDPSLMKKIEIILKDSDGKEVIYPLDGKDYSLKFKDGCQVGLGNLDMGDDQWIIGDTFLRRYYSIFDDAHGQIGFTKAQHDDESIGVVARGIFPVILPKRYSDFF